MMINPNILNEGNQMVEENTMIKDKKDKVINLLLERIATLEYEVEELQKENDLDCNLNKSLLKDIDKAGKEIERLNNIINELEKYINEEYIYDELGMKIFDASKLQDKLQELKGSDKE